MKTFKNIKFLTSIFVSCVYLMTCGVNVSFAQDKRNDLSFKNLKTIYTPSDSTVSQTHFFEIKGNILDAVKNSLNNDPSMYARISTKQLEIIEADSKTVKFLFIYPEMEALKVLDYSKETPNLIAINLKKDLAVGWLSCDNCRDKDIKYAKQLADAFYALKFKKFYQINTEEELNKFKTVSEQYQSLNPKPELNEEARKFIVQATSLAKEQKYFDAIKLYQKAIEIDQSYPEAHFNIALLLSQEEDYEYAVLEMKKYLMLAPDAKDARASQDKIYEWEVKIK